MRTTSCSSSSSISHLSTGPVTHLQLLLLPLLLLFPLPIIFEGGELNWLHSHTEMQPEAQRFPHTVPCRTPRAAQLVWHSVPDVWGKCHMCIHYSEACQSTIAVVGSLRLQLFRWTFSRQTVGRRADTRGSEFEVQLEFHVHVCSCVTPSCVSNLVTCRSWLWRSLCFRAFCSFVCLSGNRIIKLVWL